MTDKKRDIGITENDLDVFFAAGRAKDPTPSADLMERVIADAGAVQVGFGARVQDKRPVRAGFLANVGTFFGGWGAVSALTACVCLGVFAGLSAPDIVMSYVPGVETQTDDLGFGLFGSFAEAELTAEG